MASLELSDRVSKLEAEVARLRQLLGCTDPPGKDDWKLAVEKYKGDEDLLAIFKEAEKLREADREATRDINGGLTNDTP